jgi:hypothetical protein
MTSQSNKSKISLNKISSYILDEQNIDIRNYTSGHLNENHLWKPPEQKTHKTWEASLSVSLENLKTPRDGAKLSSRSINSQKKKNDLNYSARPETNETVVNISGGSSKTSKVSYKSFPNKYLNSRNETIDKSELKLPNLVDANSEYVKSEVRLPITNMELAIKVLRGPFVGASKEERFKNMTRFEKEVINKSDLVKTNVLHSTDPATNLENYLNEVIYLVLVKFRLKYIEQDFKFQLI